MAEGRFILTPRTKDLEEVYRDKLIYRFFSQANLPALFLGALCLVFAVVCIYKTLTNDAFFFLSVCFLFGLGYQVINLFKSYTTFKTGKKEIEKWIRDIQQYKSHSIVFGNGCFRYLRDGDIHVFDIKAVRLTFRTATHFYFGSTDKLDIMLPKKSFEPGEFERFLSCFDEIANALRKPDSV